MAKKRKHIRMAVTVSVPHWMSASQARREVRTLVNDQSSYMSHGPNYEEPTVKARKVEAAR